LASSQASELALILTLDSNSELSSKPLFPKALL
jgi:hypothetical protein